MKVGNLATRYIMTDGPNCQSQSQYQVGLKCYWTSYIMITDIISLLRLLVEPES